MRRPFSGRRRFDLVLDAVFVVWALQVMLTGRLLPTYVAHLLHHPPQTAAVSEKKDAPLSPIQIAPALPET